MNEIKLEKLKRFLNDTVMSEAVRETITKSFLKPSKDRDVQILASKMIAIELLDEAWKELLKLKTKEENNTEIKKQIGV